MKVKQQVRELFPTPLWVLDIASSDAVPFNAKLRDEIEKIISPRPNVPSGSNWQTPHDLHTRPAFATFTRNWSRSRRAASPSSCRSSVIR